MILSMFTVAKAILEVLTVSQRNIRWTYNTQRFVIIVLGTASVELAGTQKWRILGIRFFFQISAK